MLTIKVKICGITNLDDALVALEAGADYLGFIFYPPSKRSIDQKSARRIVTELRAKQDCPQLIGVFVDETAARMSSILDHVNLDWAQLSGEEVPYLVADERSPLFGRAFKAIQPTSLAEAEAEAEWYIPSERPADLPAILIDTHHPTLRGGTGQTGDWELSGQLAKKVPGLMLAGGLNAGNVAAAVRQVRPFAVDVASGVEAKPGKKDHDLVRLFIQQAKEA
jgi:phosphoribosylanthranilate isomerase